MFVELFIFASLFVLAFCTAVPAVSKPLLEGDADPSPTPDPDPDPSEKPTPDPEPVDRTPTEPVAESPTDKPPADTEPEPKADAEPTPAAAPPPRRQSQAVVEYQKNIEAQRHQREVAELREQNARLVETHRQLAAANARAAPPVTAPMVPGVTDEELDETTKVLMRGNKEIRDEQRRLGQRMEEMNTTFTDARQAANRASLRQNLDEELNNLIEREDIFKPEKNKRVVELIRADMFGFFDGGTLTPENFAPTYQNLFDKYAQFLVDPDASTGKEKIDAAIERKDQAGRETTMGQPTGGSSGEVTDTEKAKLRDIRDPFRFKGIFGNQRKKMQAAGDIGPGG